MPPRSRPERLIQELQVWQDEELAELAAMITGLLESRQQEVVDASQEQRKDGTPVGRHLRYWGVTKKGTKGLKSVHLGKGAGANK